MYPLKVRHFAYPWHVQRALTSSGIGKSHRRAVTIGMLLDDVLLEIFDFCRRIVHDDYPFWPAVHPVSNWCILVHVCRRWRQIIFESLHRLNLRILCTHRTLVSTNLGVWPALPIVLELFSKRRLEPQDEQNVITALQHQDRVCSVRLYTASSQLAKVVAVMQEPLPMLTDLYMRQTDFTVNTPVLTAEFLGGFAPHMQEVTLYHIPFPALPTLLLSTSDLVTLNLFQIPKSGYISPEKMVACLAALPRLQMFTIEFRQFASFRPDQMHPSPVTRHTLPSLTDFTFSGEFKYLEDLVAQIDSPRLERVSIVYVEPPDHLQATQLSEFIDRSIGPELTPSRHALVHFHSGVALTLTRKYPNSPNCDRRSVVATISRRSFEWELPDVERVLSQFSAMALSLLPPSSTAFTFSLPRAGARPPPPPGVVPMDIAPDGPPPAPGVVGKSGKPGNRGPAPPSEDDSLSVFDVLNIFRRRWFLSRAALVEHCLSAQKAEDGSISWVEFSPPFHSHLVKCAVALVPHRACPVPMVKKVMFVFILELLNREGHLAVFDLQKGGRKANNAQKEKRRLARKRSRAAKREREREAAKAAKLPPCERECLTCGRKFQSRKTAKRHKCARHSKVVRKKEEAAVKPGLRPAPPAKPIKPAAPITPLAPPAPAPKPAAPKPAPAPGPSYSNIAPPVTGDLGEPPFPPSPPNPFADSARIREGVAKTIADILGICEGLR